MIFFRNFAPSFTLLLKFRMFGVIGSYRELTGFQPVELTDVCSAAEVMSVNSTSHRLVIFCGQRPLTTVNYWASGACGI